MKKRILPAVLCLVLSLGLLAPPARAAAQPVSPAPAIVVTPIRDGETLEISIRTTAAARAVYAVLSYDDSLLTPIQWDKDKTPIAVPVGTSWGNAAAIHTLGCGGASGKPGLTYRAADGDEAYLYLGAESMAEPLPGDTVVVTARFRYAGGVSEAQKALAASSVAFAAEAVAADAPANYVEAVIDADGNYLIDAAAAPNGEYTLLSKGEVQVQPEGSSQLPEGSTVTGGHAVVFFDWDGSVLSAISAPQDAASAVEAETEKLTELKEKTGYAFQGWVLSDSARTAYNPGDQLPAFLDFKDVTEPDLLVQAVYQGSGELRVKSNTTKSSDYVLDEANIYYTRYGAATAKDGKYSIKVSFDRTFTENGAKIGVERAETPGALVGMTPANTSLATLYSFLGGESSERITFEIVPTRDMASVSVYMVDIYGVAAWPNAGSRSGSAYTIKAAEFIKYGTANYICEQGILSLQGSGQSEWDKYVDAQAFKDAKGGTAVGNVENAKAAVKSELERIYTAENEYRVLTYAEFTAAISGK